MGSSATARIVFGFDLGTDFRFGRPQDIGEDAWEDVAGSDPSESLRAILLIEAGLAADAEGAAADAVITGCPFEAVDYGATSHEAGWVLALKRPKVTGYWDSAEPFNPASLAVDEAEVRTLTEVAARHGLTGTLGWLLLAEYG